LPVLTSSPQKVVSKLGPPTLALVAVCLALITLPPHRAASAAAMTSGELRTLVEQSKAALGAGNYTEALGAYTTLHQADPNNPAYARELATIYGALHRPADEIRLWEQFLRNAPLPAEACPHLGVAYRNTGNQLQALKAFERCYGYDHNNTDAIFNYALALERQGDFPQAERLYEQGLKIRATYLDLRTGLARAALHQGHSAQAAREVARVLQQEPTNVDALLVAGLAAQREGDAQAARQYLARGLKLAPEYEEFKTALARLDAAGASR
jgi:tetratricopeptide (TPR) repeat protein